ncbi:formate dehydrogenase accessory sulfurtransferase FdhD [Bradyrhizobium genosp. L]|uniref:formate dehydrogenase accessory sulfurtransferase FdhD n=1 Tax=Bradyrhizobium genosp. L TaxID=83637 RepID=UPI001FEE7FFE|nr:formate dehydrogenase accessory sulfurtransferase FdhD [Bradyrhizobium genosp. L]
MHGFRSTRHDRIPTPTASIRMPRLTSHGTQDQRVVAEECPVALVFDGTTMAVLMATPSDLTDLALGFCLTEGLVEDAGEIEEVSVVPGADGIELRTWLRPRAGRLLKDRRRRLVGPTGCGLCGIESLAEANRMKRTVVRRISLTPDQIRISIERLGAAQILNHATRATHAAGFFRPGQDDMILREDVGRHNALDKLAGALASQGVLGHTGAVALTSRISVELVQKAAAIGVGIVVAVSAPTALAIRTAEASGLTLIGIARGSDFEIFSHPAGVCR